MDMPKESNIARNQETNMDISHKDWGKEFDMIINRLENIKNIDDEAETGNLSDTDCDGENTSLPDCDIKDCPNQSRETLNDSEQKKLNNLNSKSDENCADGSKSRNYDRNAFTPTGHRQTDLKEDRIPSTNTNITKDGDFKFPWQSKNGSQVGIMSPGMGTHNPDPPPSYSWKKAVYQFCQQTSIHGLKQITEPQPFFSRRLTWIVLLLLGSGFFIYQTLDAVIYYYSWPVSVNIIIKHNQTIRFPAVTLCNHNAFRATVAVDTGIYDMVTDYYSHYHDNDTRTHGRHDIHNRTTLEDVYLNTAHTLEDFIVGCEWDSNLCEYEDFVTTFTDYGVCYTFNSKEPVKLASQTGSLSGLRLKLNIEQYEYMKGPNTGAGLKVLIHNQNDIPAVRDYGLAVPPGAHALIGITLKEIYNLEAPHGECDDHVTLTYYDNYSTSSCLLDCIQAEVIRKCGCRDIYMAPGNSSVPVCNLEEYEVCIRPVFRSLLEMREECTCPSPCYRLLYVPTVTYSAISNYDLDRMLSSNSIPELQKRFVKAREVAQRVRPETTSRDKLLFENLDARYKTLIEVFESWDVSFQEADRILNTIVLPYMRARKETHLKKGLENVEYVVKHEFVRGWEVMEERGMAYVANNLLNIILSYERYVTSVKETLPLSETTARQAAWLSMENTLVGRRDIAAIARQNITQVYEAYTQGHRLVKYKLSPDKHYDNTYITLHILLSGIERDKLDSYYNKLVEGADHFIEALDTLVDLGENFTRNNMLDEAMYNDTKEKLFSAGKQYNYRMFLFRDRVVQKPLELIREKIEVFKSLWEDFLDAYGDLRIKIHDSKFQLKYIRESWEDSITPAHADAMEYLINPNVTKVGLSERITSKFMDNELNWLHTLFGNVRSNIKVQSERWIKLQIARDEIWKNMVKEESLFTFYKHVQQDYDAYVSGHKDVGKYLAYILEGNVQYPVSVPEPLEFLSQATMKEFLNADIHGTDLQARMALNRAHFMGYHYKTELSAALRDHDDYFLEAMEDLRSSLREFLHGNRIGGQFIKENFLTVDIFVEDKRFEQIIQQEDYSIPKLLSDVGGSVGLFIGASVLSLFEFIDVVLFHGMEKKRAKRSQRRK